MKKSFIERTISSLLSASQYAAGAEDLAVSLSSGALQAVDPRVKVAGLFTLILVVVASRRLEAIAALFVCAVLLALASRVQLRKLAALVWLPVLFFTGTIAAPALFLTPGQQGLRAAAFLVSRAETAATLSALLVLTTPWPWVMKALRTFRCPAVFVVILGMTYRYLFVILETALDMFESRQSRTVGVLEPADRRRLSAATAGVLLSKSLQLSSEVHLAMQSRGFRGEIHIMRDFRAKTADWCWLGGFASIAGAAAWFAV